MIQRIQCQGLTAISNLLDIIGWWPLLADGDDANGHHDLLGTAGVCLATWRSVSQEMVQHSVQHIWPEEGI